MRQVVEPVFDDNPPCIKSRTEFKEVVGGGSGPLIVVEVKLVLLICILGYLKCLSTKVMDKDSKGGVKDRGKMVKHRWS